jgi:ankyrin repeat protein
MGSTARQMRGRVVLAAVALILGAGLWRTNYNAALARFHARLLEVAMNGSAETLDAMIGDGADVNDTNERGKPLLVLAVIGDNLDNIHVLLRRGADIHRNTTPNDLLRYAAAYARPQIVRLWINKGADVNARAIDGSTAWMGAVEAGRLANVQELLSHKADVDAADQYGETALMKALARRNPDIAAALRKAHAKPPPPGWRPVPRHYSM